MAQPLLLSTTALSDAALCLKRYEYRHVDHLAPRPSDLNPRIRRGLWIHRALEFHAAGKQWQEGLADCAVWAQSHGVEQERVDEMLRECAVILTRYFNYYEQQPYWRWTYDAHEIKLVHTTPSGVVLQATADAIVRWRGGRWLVEYKTTSDIPSPVWRGVDPQTAMQLALCYLDPEYADVEGIIFDYLLTREPSTPRVKNDGMFYSTDEKMHTTTDVFHSVEREVRAKWSPKHAPLTADEYLDQMRLNMVNDGHYFQRFEVRRPTAAINETLRDARVIARSIKLAEMEGHYPRLSNILYCQRFCSYQRLCASEYVSGHPLEVMRAEDFIVDDGSDREGRGPVE